MTAARARIKEAILAMKIFNVFPDMLCKYMDRDQGDFEFEVTPQHFVCPKNPFAFQVLVNFVQFERIFHISDLLYWPYLACPVLRQTVKRALASLRECIQG